MTEAAQEEAAAVAPAEGLAGRAEEVAVAPAEGLAGRAEEVHDLVQVRKSGVAGEFRAVAACHRELVVVQRLNGAVLLQELVAERLSEVSLGHLQRLIVPRHSVSHALVEVGRASEVNQILEVGQVSEADQELAVNQTSDVSQASAVDLELAVNPISAAVAPELEVGQELEASQTLVVAGQAWVAVAPVSEVNPILAEHGPVSIVDLESEANPMLVAIAPALAVRFELRKAIRTCVHQDCNQVVEVPDSDPATRKSATVAVQVQDPTSDVTAMVGNSGETAVSSEGMIATVAEMIVNSVGQDGPTSIGILAMSPAGVTDFLVPGAEMTRGSSVAAIPLSSTITL